jgi:serine/threonine protein kinase
VKACSGCGRLYPTDAGFCPVDGTVLDAVSNIPVVPDDSDPRIGQVLCERYEIRRVVADGGMGRVYEALDLQEGAGVAVKILHPEVATEPVAIGRLEREFEVNAQLPHQHIVEVRDFQPTGDGTYAIVMEFLYGEELRATLRRTKVIRPARLVRMVSQVAIGLDEAHERGFVHRDLKPDNLFLCQTQDGDIVKVLDFGSVKDTGEGAKKLTVVGTTVGSPFYMPPEQAQGLESLDFRADVWAMAVIVYECVSGKVPFTGTNGPSILLAIVSAEPEPASIAARGQRFPVPPSVDTALSHAMQKIASRRTVSIGAFADELGRAYGLEGDHLVWAQTPEEALHKAIEAQMPGLMAAPPTSASLRTAEALARELDSVMPGPLLSETPVPPSEVLPVSAERAASAWVLPTIVVLALGLGVLIAWLMP